MFFFGFFGFKNYFLVINAERYAMYAPSFVNKLSKTKNIIMQEVIDRLSAQK